MDVIEQLIKSLQEAKAELEKNMNCAPGDEQNMDKAEGKKPAAPKKKLPAPGAPIDSADHPSSLSTKDAMKLVKEEDEQEELVRSENGQWSLKKDAANPANAPKDKKVKALQQQIDAGTYKPDSKKIAGAMLKEEEPHKDDPKHEEKEQKIASKIKAEASDLMDMHKEELHRAENGQWNIVEKAVRKPVIGSHNAYEIGRHGEGKASHAKYHGGDPRHVDTKGPKTRAGIEREIPDTVAYVEGSSGHKLTAKKPKTFTSGVSDLSTHYDENESGRKNKVKLKNK